MASSASQTETQSPEARVAERDAEVSRSRRLALVLLCAAFLAPVLCTWWARDAYPFIDESQVVATALGLELRYSSPPQANWPPHAYHLLRTEWFLGRTFCALPPLESSYDELVQRWYSEPTVLLHSARALSLALALIAIWLCYRLSRRVLPPVAAAAAALLFATSPLCLQYARYMVTEMPHALWTTAALLAGLCLLQRKRATTAFAGGLATALAVASKYLGGLAGIAVLWGWAVAGSSGAATRWRGAGAAARGALAIALGFALGLAIGIPDLFAHHEPYRAWLEKHFAATEWTWFGFEDAPPPYAFHATITLPHVAGSIWGLAAAAIGLAILAVKQPRAAVALALFSAAYFAIAGGNAIRYTRYFLVLSPVLAIGIAALAQALAARCGRPWGSLAASGLVLACALPTFLSSAAQARTAGRGDTRHDAAVRLRETGATGGGLVTLRARRVEGELAFLPNPEYPLVDASVLELNLTHTLDPGRLILWDSFLARYDEARGRQHLESLLPRLLELGAARAPANIAGYAFPSAEALYDALIALGLDRYLWSGFVDGVFDDLEPETHPEARRFLELVQRNELLWKVDPGGELRADLPRVELVTQGSAHRGAEIGGPELRLYALRPRS